MKRNKIRFRNNKEGPKTAWVTRDDRTNTENGILNSDIFGTGAAKMMALNGAMD